MIRLVLLSAILPAAFAHDLWITGLDVALRSNETVVTARVHKLNLSGNDIAGEISSRVRLLIEGQRFQAAGVSVRNDPANDIVIWTGRAPVSGSAVTVERPVFPDIDADRTIVTVENVGTAVLDSKSRNIRIGEPLSGLVLRFIREGIQHILEGADHLAFLIAILLPVRRVRDLVSVITAFTVAHSVTLTMAATGVFSISPRIVEPAIAVSIVIAALENLHSSGAGVRLRMSYAFGFGLIHGFGFAGSLAETGLPAYALWPAVLSFNTGVEIGQLLVVAVLAPVAVAMQARRPLLRAAVVRYASVAIMALGLAWSVQRLTW